MGLHLFHKTVKDWFSNSFNAPTSVQEQAWKAIKERKHVLIAAPTGSGKTLAAFMSAIDDLVSLGMGGALEQRVHVVYISPLKALSNDIEKNLRVPVQEIKKALKEDGLPNVKIDVAVRTGDTSQSERTAMIKKPPHIIVTTPESLYLLLTSMNGRKMLSTVNTVIVDEIHAMVWDKRGSHLALSLERLNKLTTQSLTRIGISATQKPIEQVAQFLTGVKHTKNGIKEIPCTIVDSGHSRELDLGIELPNSPLTAVMANEVWGEIYDRLINLIESHKTTLIFVNTRRLAERLSLSLTEHLGEEVVMAHHGSMSKEHRYEAEKKLKDGQLRALVATASLELGIDIGSIDLVCQIGSVRSIATFLQRVGRSGHTVVGIPKGRLFPLTRDELVESVAIIDAIRRKELDRIVIPEQPIDILSQQIVAEVAGQGEYSEEGLYEICRSAYPYRQLSRELFDQSITMLAEGYVGRKGRRAAYLHHDKVNGNLTARKGARLTALISGGAIPDQFDYDVILEPQGTFVGTLDEDFSVESLPGDVFQLGNNTWRILRIENGKVRVEDATGEAPTIPFWLGEAPGRTIELSQAVARIRKEVGDLLGSLGELEKQEGNPDEQWKEKAVNWLQDEVGVSSVAADQTVMYLATGKAALGVMPTHDTLVLERFFDETGDMHLVIHSPYGSRLNRAWGLSIRKKFCRKFNFELQAAATEEAIVLSLGATHSFKLDEVFHYLHPKTARNTLIQALLDAPMFEIRWRWNASRALAILRMREGGRVPPQIQRMQSEDLIAQTFPDQLACLENIGGERDVPEHPLVDQTIHDCLTEAMDIDLLEQILTKIHTGEMELVAKDLREPSVLAQEIINAKPYAFLDPSEAAERRTNAVQHRRWLDPAEAKDLAKLDSTAIEMVKEEAWPHVGSYHELHDALVVLGFITKEEGEKGDWSFYLEELKLQNRAVEIELTNQQVLWVATERLPEVLKIHTQAICQPIFEIPERILNGFSSDKNPLVELTRSRLEGVGPIEAITMAKLVDVEYVKMEQALKTLENEGFVFRGEYTPDLGREEWCERHLLARIHKYTLQKLRKEIEPVISADYMRFVFQWHGLPGNDQPEGPEALQRTLDKLEGFEAQAVSWESDLLPSRVKEYDHNLLDFQCLSGNTIWGRFRPNGTKTSGPIKTTPITLVSRLNMKYWQLNGIEAEQLELSKSATKVVESLQQNGALFFDAIVSKTRLFENEVEESMNELVAAGLLTSDSYVGLRALLIPHKYKSGSKRKTKSLTFNVKGAGRWSLIPLLNNEVEDKDFRQLAIEKIAMILLKRYGVVFRKVVDREKNTPPWRELVRAFRLLEARGKIRGGRFVQGVWGEQFSLPEAIPILRKIRKDEQKDELVSISASDPLNMTGVLTPGKRIPAIYSNRILYKGGEPIAVKEGKEVKFLKQFSPDKQWEYQKKLVQRKVSSKLRNYLGKGVF